jgi:quercetin dioxygenase-like cupin family protein
VHSVSCANPLSIGLHRRHLENFFGVREGEDRYQVPIDALLRDSRGGKKARARAERFLEWAACRYAIQYSDKNEDVRSRMAIKPTATSIERREFIVRVNGTTDDEIADGVELRTFASDTRGAIGFCTAMATMRPLSRIPYHTHRCVEVIIPLSGTADVDIEGRRYQIGPYDAIFIPAGVAHSVRNAMTLSDTVLHVSFNDGSPGRSLVEDGYDVENLNEPPEGVPERLIRFASAITYQLAEATAFRDLFAKRLGSSGICGGYGTFQPGAALPCHVHDYDESITIVQGHAICQSEGREYALSDYDTACIPKGQPHRFINRTNKPMAMIWVYAGDEPDRLIVEPSRCQVCD